mmetsp:Transcript_53364/g.126188  ORF Transcript_53364/g.126188 Transcript_53364/m.126188 type:complete len:208 (-) Transcript_53364:1014-1637(-)
MGTGAVPSWITKFSSDAAAWLSIASCFSRCDCCAIGIAPLPCPPGSTPHFAPATPSCVWWYRSCPCSELSSDRTPPRVCSACPGPLDVPCTVAPCTVAPCIELRNELSSDRCSDPSREGGGDAILAARSEPEKKPPNLTISCIFRFTLDPVPCCCSFIAAACALCKPTDEPPYSCNGAAPPPPPPASGGAAPTPPGGPQTESSSATI